MTDALPRPDPSEFDEYYARYVDLVPTGNVLITLRDQLPATLALLRGLSLEAETTPYAVGKWSLREVFGHLVDVERLFQFRALAMAREDGVDLPGMDHDEWAGRSDANARALADHIEEWTAVRRAGVHLFASFDSDTGMRTGRASGKPFSVRAFPWIIAGHELWHRHIIREKYMAVEGTP
jgi:hypothetical protein